MCSLNDDDLCIETYSNVKELDTKPNDICRQCQSNQSKVLLRQKDAYCSMCFLATCRHKFRSTLGKSKLVKPKDVVLVAFSGNQSSTALLHLLLCGLQEENHKRLLFKTHVCYIDEGAILNQSFDERQETNDKIRTKVREHNFSFYLTALEDYLNIHGNIINENIVLDKRKEEELCSIFENITSMSAKEDFLAKLKQKLLIRVARQLSCTMIFTAEVGTDLAVKLLSNIAQGRGSQLVSDVGFCDTRYDDVKIIRPLREFTKKEIIFYNQFHNLESVTVPSLTTKSPSSISVKKLTEEFVTGLDKEFPSTIYTVFRTGEKLSNSNSVENSELCVLCDAPITKTGSTSSAVSATAFSKLVSTRDPKYIDDADIKGSSDGCSTDRSSCSDGGCRCTRSQGAITRSEAELCLCYGCYLVIKDMVSLDHLPTDIVSAIRERCDFNKMKDKISDFLL